MPEALSDNFDRPNSPTLGAPWMEAFETFLTTVQNGTTFGPGFIELDNGALTFHLQPPCAGCFAAAPVAYAPLSKRVSSFPVTYTFAYTPTRVQRTSAIVGLMTAPLGFVGCAFGPVLGACRGALSLNAEFDWAGDPYPATVTITINDQRSPPIIQSAILGRKDLAFQFRVGSTYRFNVTIQRDLSTIVQVSNGQTMDTVTGGPTCIDSALNELYIAEGGSVDTSFGVVDYFLRFDDVAVSQTTNGLPGSFCGQAVQIDIKPGSFPNSMNLGSQGTVPVGIFSTPTFDARTVEPASITLAGAQIALKGKGTPMFSFQDVNGDGLLDLVVHVTTEALQLSETDTEAVLEGNTFRGVLIRGVDSVRVVP